MSTFSVTWNYLTLQSLSEPVYNSDIKKQANKQKRHETANAGMIMPFLKNNLLIF